MVLVEQTPQLKPGPSVKGAVVVIERVAGVRGTLQIYER